LVTHFIEIEHPVPPTGAISDWLLIAFDRWNPVRPLAARRWRRV
jgi:hypothetical protein